MSEWKTLQVDNLPPDILTGDYEFQRLEQHGAVTELETGMEWLYYDADAYSVIYICDTNKFRYRKPEPKAPSHEEIMTKWWKIDNDYQWYPVISYIPKDNQYFIGAFWHDKDYFIGRKSADIPPED